MEKMVDKESAGEEEDPLDDDFPNFEVDGEESDQDVAGEELSEVELAVMKEINEEEIEVDLDSFLKETENNNTRATTVAIVAKYNRVMALVAKKHNKKFLLLVETPREEIPGLLASFFKIIRTKKEELYNASSLNTFLGSFGRYFADNFHPPIDMKSEIGFNQVRKTLDRMKKKAQATKGKKPGENASRAIAPRHLKLAWAKGHIGRDNPDALSTASYLACTTGLGCRAVREVHSITNGSLVFGPIGYGGVPEFIELDEQWVSKNRVGRDARLLEARVNPDHDHPESCHVRTIMEMMRRKTERQCLPDAKFWWNVKESARMDPMAHEKWFKNNHAGKHSIEKLLTNALAKAGVDCKKEKYTATSARKVMLDGGQDAGVPDTILGRKAGHRSDHSKRSYIENKDITHRATNIVLSRVAAGGKPNYQEVLNKLQTADDEAEKAAVSEKFEVEYYDDEFEYTISQSRLVVKENLSVKNNLSSASQPEFAPSCSKSLKLAEKQYADPQNDASKGNPIQKMHSFADRHVDISNQGQKQQLISPGYQVLSPCQQMVNPGQQVMLNPGQQMMLNPGQQMMLNPSQQMMLNPGQQMKLNTGQQMMLSPGQQMILNNGQQMMPHPGQQMMLYPGQQMLLNTGQQMMFNPGQQMMLNPGQQMMLNAGQQMMLNPGQQMMLNPGQQMMLNHQMMFNPNQQMSGMQSMLGSSSPMVRPSDGTSISSTKSRHSNVSNPSSLSLALAARPSAPTARPSAPAARPSAPAARSSAPVARHSAPVARPSASSAPPEKPVQSESSVALKPSKSNPLSVGGRRAVTHENKENVPGISIGDVMFHKMKGLPYWPVRVTDIQGRR